MEKQLPPEKTTVLCWYEYYRYGEYNSMYQTYGIGWHFRDGMFSGEVANGSNTRVLAWMSLPEPFEEERVVLD